MREIRISANTQGRSLGMATGARNKGFPSGFLNEFILIQVLWEWQESITIAEAIHVLQIEIESEAWATSGGDCSNQPIARNRELFPFQVGDVAVYSHRLSNRSFVVDLEVHCDRSGDKHPVLRATAGTN